MNFQKFDPSVQDKYLQFYKRLPPYSDFSFNNLLVWLDINDDLEYAIVNNNFVFKFTNPFNGGKTAYTLIGDSEVLDTLEKVFAELDKNNLPRELSMVPACFAEKLLELKPDNIEVINEPDNRDYLFDIPAARAAKGKIFYHLRRGMNYFIKNYGDEIRVKPLDLTTLEDRVLVINSMHRWESVFSLTENDRLRVEGLAIDRYLRLAPILKPKCVGLFIQDKMEAFSIFHLPPQEKYAIGNHIKCNYQFRGIFNVMYYATVGEMYDLGARTANEEQDLGIAGIREHKEARNPIGYLNRYTIKDTSSV